MPGATLGIRKVPSGCDGRTERRRDTRNRVGSPRATDSTRRIDRRRRAALEDISPVTVRPGSRQREVVAICAIDGEIGHAPQRRAARLGRRPHRAGQSPFARPACMPGRNTPANANPGGRHDARGSASAPDADQRSPATAGRRASGRATPARSSRPVRFRRPGCRRGARAQRCVAACRCRHVRRRSPHGSSPPRRHPSSRDRTPARTRRDAWRCRARPPRRSAGAPAAAPLAHGHVRVCHRDHRTARPGPPRAADAGASTRKRRHQILAGREAEDAIDAAIVGHHAHGRRRCAAGRARIDGRNGDARRRVPRHRDLAGDGGARQQPDRDVRRLTVAHGHRHAGSTARPRRP